MVIGGCFCAAPKISNAGIDLFIQGMLSYRLRLGKAPGVLPVKFAGLLIFENRAEQKAG
jgi:hypothetical protein